MSEYLVNDKTIAVGIVYSISTAKVVKNLHIRKLFCIFVVETDYYLCKVFVLRPSENISVGRLEKDVARLQALHQLGVSDATRLWDDLAQYLSL